ncbi:unnamed protein product [Amoebophrya sp. A120]|nr:unnamed protein product [Amoebophrya sp. A120]|eukprot:GSA120T00021196001.1
MIANGISTAPRRALTYLATVAAPTFHTLSKKCVPLHFHAAAQARLLLQFRWSSTGPTYNFVGAVYWRPAQLGNGALSRRGSLYQPRPIQEVFHFPSPVVAIYFPSIHDEYDIIFGATVVLRDPD